MRAFGCGEREGEGLGDGRCFETEGFWVSRRDSFTMESTYRVTFRGVFVYAFFGYINIVVIQFLMMMESML